MGRYIGARLLQAIPVVLLTSAGIFLLIHLVPGDPALALLGQDALPAQIEATRRRLGLDEPIPIQYLRWLSLVVQGDLGVSHMTGLPVIDLLSRRFLVSMHLAVATILFVTPIAIVLGVVTAVRPRALVSRIVVALNGVAMAVPNFWLGIILILVVGLQLRWLPTSGFVSIFDDPVQSLRLLILPTLTLSAYIIAILSRFTRAAVLDVLHEDYVRTARAKGLRERSVIGIHVLRNALLTVVTMVGIQFGNILGGTVIVEAIFDFPGLGRGLLDAIFMRDYAVVQGTILLVVLIFILANLLADLLYVRLDPRIRYD